MTQEVISFWLSVISLLGAVVSIIFAGRAANATVNYAKSTKDMLSIQKRQLAWQLFNNNYTTLSEEYQNISVIIKINEPRFGTDALRWLIPAGNPQGVINNFKTQPGLKIFIHSINTMLSLLDNYNKLENEDKPNAKRIAVNFYNSLLKEYIEIILSYQPHIGNTTNIESIIKLREKMEELQK
jgi:hypothetical protein